MATTATNNIKRSDAAYAVIEDAKPFISTAVSWNQGDLIYLDTTNHLLKAVGADADTANFVGVAKQTISSGLIKSPYTTAVDSNQAITAIAGPVAGVTALLKLNNGDTFHPGDKVYPIASVDAQTVSSSSNTGARHPCGIFVGSTVTAGASSTGLVRLEAQVPVAWT